VIAGVPRDRVDAVYVVDNGSTDRTAEIARAAGASVVREERRGYGYACAAGVAATGAFDVLAFMDGDGSDDASQIGALIEPLERDEADLVLGSRVLESGTSGALLPHQRLGNALTTALIRLLYGQRLSDLPPFKAIRRFLLDELDMGEMTYGWTVEMIVKCARRADARRGGCRIVEVPVSARARLGGRSKVSGTIRGTVLAAYYMLSTTLKYAWRG
jgi:glycosyltransferase involved in cell wall biosynthesis